MTDTFADLGVPAPIVKQLTDRGIDSPFPIQVATIPDSLAGRDICGKAPTGSGKTIAFGIPMIAAVKRAAPKRPKGLVLAPTRELAIQVADELSLLGDLRVLAVYGGAGIEPQIKKLRAGVDIVVACPGRLLDVMDRKACDLRDVNFVVVDEADRMADMGFLPDVKRILDQTAPKRQTLLFSATLDGAIDALVKGYQKNPVIHEMPDEETGHIVHHFWVSERQGRAQLAAEIIERTGPTIVFSRTRHGADRIAKQLEQAGVSAAAIHGARSQSQRERALSAFHRGEVHALVATDVAARGIHVEGVTCVIHFDIPADPKDYVHRSGRTGRAGNEGTVVALIPAAQKRDATKLARQAGVAVEITEPNVSILPEGHAAFRTSGRSKPAPARHTSKRPANAKPKRDDRFRTERPERAASKPAAHSRPRDDDRNGPSRTAAAPRTRPASAEGEERKSSRPDRKDAPNRADRRKAAFGEIDSDTRKARADAKQKSAKAPAERSSDDALTRSLSASDKVRPSGASRRKAKREAMVAEGITPPSGKRRR